MMTLSKVTDSKAAAAYYGEVDDYYIQGQAPTEWLGNGAAAQGLTGEVDKEDFTRLLEGTMPDGTQMAVGGDGSRRAGTDFTFSAPKSVSLQALVGGDDRLIDAHQNAVRATMAYVENNLAAYRVRDREAGTLTVHKSGNLIATAIRHDVSRAVDPQLHTHVVVMNATRTAAGTWRALDHTEILQQQKLIGSLYRNELAHEVQRLGYSLRVEHADGRFELAHIDRGQITAFSQRSQAIERALTEAGRTRGETSARHKEKIALATREAKGEIDRAEMRREWQEKSRLLAINYSPTLAPREHNAEMRASAATAALSYAVENHIERQSVVDERKLTQTALGRGVGHTDLNSIRSERERLIATGHLIENRARHTTQEAQQREREILGVEWRGRSAVRPMLSERAVKDALRDSGLNAGQRAAANLMLTTQNQVVAVQGVAGAGKTTMLKTARELAARAGYQVVGIAPSAAAVKALAETGIDSRTLAAFQHRKEETLTAKTLLIVDESSMIGARDLHQLLYRIEATGARAVLVGDTRQLKAVQAGQPFAQLQQEGMATAKMDEIMRQRSTLLNEAVELAACGDIHHSIELLSKRIVEVDHAKQRHEAMARDYLSLSTADQSSTLMVAGTRSARAAINHQVREQLGRVGQGVALTALENKDLTEAQRKSPRSYQPGDVVQVERDYPSLSLERGEMATVIDFERATVTLARADGERVQWTPREQPNLTAYRTEAREFTIGDSVRFTKNEHTQGVINGERGTVAIDAAAETLTIAKRDGDIVTLSTSAPQHLDYGYASTVHTAQGLTCERVMIDADTASVTANEAQFYVAISRAQHEVTLYTDDRDLLPEAMSRGDVKTMALDVVNERELSRPFESVRQSDSLAL